MRKVESFKLVGYCIIGCCCNTFVHLLSVAFFVAYQSPSADQVPAVGLQFGRVVVTLNVGTIAAWVNHRRACPWKHCLLLLSLVSWCCHHPHNSPPKLDGSLFISSLMRKHSRWKSGKLRAHIFFRSACLHRFSHGVQRPHRPFVDLHTSTLDGFCDGSKDFLKLPQLLSKFHSVDYSKNVHECSACIHAMRGTYGGTYGNKNMPEVI